MGLRTNVSDAYNALLGRRERANPVGGALFDKLSKTWGVGDKWAKTGYGDYYPASVSVYAAIKLRQEAIARVPLYVYRETGLGEEQVAPDHPLQQLLDRVNRWWTRGDLWRATETYLSLWGTAYWALSREGGQITEIWPLRPDKMKVLPDEKEYIKGFVYGTGQERRAFAPDEIVWFRYFNPLDEYAGLSPIAPLRLSVDMGMDALRMNRNALANDSSPGMIISVNDTPTDEEVLAFYQRWEERFQGPSKSRRPAVLSEGMTASNLGFSPKDMMALDSMRWSVEDVARTFNVPTPMLHDLSRATYANIMTARRSFWEDCIVPQLHFYEEELTEMLLPLAGEEGLVVRFDTSGVEALQEDEDAKAARREKYIKIGVLTVNEVRAEMGLESVEWGETPASAPSPAPITLSVGDEVGRRDALVETEWETMGRAVDSAQRRKGKKLEKAFSSELATLFRKQANQFIKAFEEENADRTAETASSNGATAVLAAPEVRQTIFRPIEWLPQFGNLARKHLTAGLIGGAESQKLGISFNVAAPAVKGWIESRARWWSKTINDGTEDKLFKIISSGRKDGIGPMEIARKLRDFREFQTVARSERVARTEMTVAQGEGGLQAFRQAEVPAKRWYTALDERVRESHMEAHGQVRRISEQFMVGMDRMEAPAQGSDPAENINCRCVLLPVTTQTSVPGL